MRKIKIIHVITGLIGAGAETMLYKLVSRLDQDIFQNMVISLQDQGIMGRRISDLGIPVYALGLRPGRPNPLPLVRLVSLLRRHRPQILQTWLYHADLVGLLAGRLAGVPAIAWNLRCSEMRQADFSRGLSLITWMLAQLSSRPQAIVANSLAGRRDHERLGYRQPRWAIIPNGFDVDLFRPCTPECANIRRDLGLPATAPLIGLVARFHPMKDHANFMAAAAHLHKLRPEANFVLVGKGVDARNIDLMNQVNELGLAGQVHLMGERRDIADITKILDIATSASAYGEGFPNAIGEAMACGVPCVVTDVGDSAYLVGETGEVVPPRAPAALAAAWQKILSLSDSKRQTLGRLARQRIVAHFSLAQVVQQYERFYVELAGESRQPH
jgi:glycosyltransferase involved in cell wall biosynthesis